MKALIDPTSLVQHAVAYLDTKPPTPVFETYPNSARVCQVETTEFEIAPPLFWTDCADDVVADQFYYDTETNEILPVVNAPAPEPVQPVAEGVTQA